MKYIIGLLASIIIISGCNTTAKVPGKLDKLNSKHVGAVAAWVGIHYPCEVGSSDTTLVRDTIRIECGGEEVALPFAIEDEAPTSTTKIPSKPEEKKVIKLQPGQSFVINPIQTTITKTIKSKADSIICADQINILNLRIVDVKDDLNKQKNKTKWWQGIAIGVSIFALILGLIIGLILKRK